MTLADEPYGYLVRPFGTEGRPIGYLAVFQSQAEAQAAMRIMQILLVISLLFLGGGIIWLSYRLAGRVVQPVLSLGHAARSLVEGGAVAYPAQRAVGELRLLAEAFNQFPHRFAARPRR